MTRVCTRKTVRQEMQNKEGDVTKIMELINPLV